MSKRNLQPDVSFRHRLSTRMLFWTVGVTGLILAVVITWNYVRVLDRLESDAKDRARFMAEGSADKIDARLGRIEGIAQGVALVIAEQNLMISFDHIRRMQAKMLRAQPELYGMAVALVPDLKPPAWPIPASYAYWSGELVEYETFPVNPHTYIGDDWFAVPRYLGKAVWSEPYFNSTGARMVTYSVPIYLSGAAGNVFAGVVTCDIDLGWLDQAIAALALGEKGYGLLVTRSGTYISHPIRNLRLNESIFSIAEARNDPGVRRLGQQIVSGVSGIVPWVSWAQEEACWLAWQPLKTVDWTMATLVSKAELKAQILRLSSDSVLLGLGGIAVLILSVVWMAGSITRPVRVLSAAAGALSADLDADLPTARGKDEVSHLTVAFSAMRDDLKRRIAELAETTAARERMNAELQVAHDIQMDLLPKTFPAFPERRDMDLFAVMEPAREVGGDFYDFFMLDDDRLVIAIADVSGKGVPAALFMAVTRSFLRAQFKAESDPGKVLMRVNEELSEGNDACMFVTLFCAVIRFSDGSVVYANAGHNPPALLRAGGHVEWISTPFGPAAGVLPGGSYESGHLVLSPQETLLLYTDGVTEAMDVQNEVYGTERLAVKLQIHSGLTCKAFLAALLADIRSHADGAEQSDDITMLMFKRIAPVPVDVGDAAVRERQFTILNSVSEIPRLAQAIDSFGEQGALTPDQIYQLNLVIEEFLTNIISYGYNDSQPHTIEISLRLDADRLTVVISDDGIAFNPLEDAPAPVLTGDVEDRPIGGLGIHLVRTLMDKIHYRRDGNKNRLTMIQYRNAESK